jgi:hypothetical protein
LVEKLFKCQSAYALLQSGYAQLVGKGSQRRQQRAQCMLRAAPRIRHTMESTPAKHQRPRIKRLQLQGWIVKDASGFRVSRLQNLKTTIEQKTAQAICSDSPPDSVRSLDDGNPYTLLLEGSCTRKTGETGTYDNHAKFV